MQLDKRNLGKAPPGESADDQAAHSPDAGRPRILMVDDDEMLLEFYEAALSSEYEVLVAGDIGTAQRLLEEQAVDSIACDLHLDGASGLDLLSWIETRQPRLLHHTMILSGDPASAPGGFHVRVLGKPVDVIHLRQAIKALLDYQGDANHVSKGAS